MNIHVPHNPRVDWTEAMEQSLKILVAEKIRAAQIADILGHGLTKSAVIGKANRLGIQWPKREKPRAKVLDKDAPEHAQKDATARKQKFKPKDRVLSQDILDGLFVYTPDRDLNAKEIWDATHSDCRWPLDGGSIFDFRFCGSRVVDGLPYCDHHASFAYRAAS